MEYWLIRHIHTLHYHLQSNQIESYNREKVRLLRLYCSEDHTSWNLYLTNVVYLLNNSLSEQNKLTPHEKFLSTPNPCFLNKALDQITERGIDPELKIIIARKAPKKTEIQLQEIITERSLVYREIHKLNSVSEHQIAKLFELYEDSYVEEKISSNRATINDIYTQSEITENFDNLRLYNCSPEKYDILMKASSAN